MIKVIMCGCNGKMGQVISDIVKEDAEVQIVAGVDLNTEEKNGYPVFGQLSDCDKEADVLIDFSHPSLLSDVLDFSITRQIPIVLCTTGLSEEQVKEVKEASKKVAILRSANMSLGINILSKLIQEAAKVLAPAGFDMEIVEKHHNQKLDAPSGTALALADSLNEAMNHEYFYKYDRSAERAKRNGKEIGISAVRGGTIVGEHEVIFAGKDEVIELKHTAYSKAIFGKGAVQAAKFLAGKEAGMYDMSDVIKKS